MNYVGKQYLIEYFLKQEESLNKLAMANQIPINFRINIDFEELEKDETLFLIVKNLLSPVGKNLSKES